MDTIISYTTMFVIYFGLFFTIFWVLVLFNTPEFKKPKIKNWPSVSILVPAYNEEDTIERTVKSILKSKYKGKLEVLVINDASKDKTVEVASKFLPKIKILDFKKNRGKAGAMNKALKEVKTEYVAVIDADSTIRPDSVERAIERFYYSPEDEEIGAVMCKMSPENRNLNLLERVQFLEYMMVGLMRNLLSSIRLLQMTNGGSFYKTKVIREVGGFDDKCLTEDFEMGVRIRKAGYLIGFAKDSILQTKTPNNFVIYLKQRIRWSRGFIQVHRKHKDIFFNVKQGWFGWYQFPMDILGPLIYFLGIFSISYNVYKKIYEWSFKLINSGFDFASIFDYGSLTQFILGINVSLDFVLLFNLLTFLVLFVGFMRFYRENYFKGSFFKKVFAFIFYIMVYNYIYIYIWIKSLYKELSGGGFDWGTK